jgi:hypothetical protein
MKHIVIALKGEFRRPEVDARTQIGSKGTHGDDKGIPKGINSNQSYENKQNNV